MSQTGLRSGQIAKMLDVKASVVSHLLIGRNQPNYKLTAKIIKVFSDYSPLWWLGLSNDPHAAFAPKVDGGNSAPTQGDSFQQQTSHSISEQTLFDSAPDRSSAGATSAAEFASLPSSRSSSEIERVIVIYKDKSFESFIAKK